MRRLLGELQILSASQRSIPGTIRGYAELRTEQEWQTVKWLIKNIQDALQKVLVQFHDSAWIFTIEEPLLVQQITALLQQRGLVLDELMTMPAPQRSDDLQALAEIADIYEKLINELQRHRDALTKLLLRSET